MTTQKFQSLIFSFKIWCHQTEQPTTECDKFLEEFFVRVLPSATVLNSNWFAKKWFPVQLKCSMKLQEKSFSLREKSNFWSLFTKSQWNDIDITCHRLLWVTDSYYPIQSRTELTNFILLLKYTKSRHLILMVYFSKPQLFGEHNRDFVSFYCFFFVFMWLFRTNKFTIKSQKCSIARISEIWINILTLFTEIDPISDGWTRLSNNFSSLPT